MMHQMLLGHSEFDSCTWQAAAHTCKYQAMLSCCKHNLCCKQKCLITKLLQCDNCNVTQTQPHFLLRATCTTCAQAQQFNHDNEHSQQQHTHSCSFHISNPSTLRTYIPSLSSTYISAILLACLHVCLLVGMHVGLPTYPT